MTALLMGGTIMSVQAQTVIDFDGFTGVITNQFPEATFSSDPGAENTAFFHVAANSTPNILCSGLIGMIDCIQPTYIDFTDPVNNLTFWAIAANVEGVTAQFNVYENGAFSATVDFVSSGGIPNNQFVDLSSFSSVTRLEIVNILDDPDNEGGIGWDTFSFDLPPGACLADLDGDGSVGASDLQALLASWGPCPPKGDCHADFDGSGDVGVSDFLELLGNWGPCP